MGCQPKPTKLSIPIEEVARYYVWSNGHTIRHYMDQEKATKKRKRLVKHTV